MTLPTTADVWRGKAEAVTDRSRRTRNHLPAARTHGILWLKLSNFDPNKTWLGLTNLELYDQGKPIDHGALGNQTSPLYVAIAKHAITR